MSGRPRRCLPFFLSLDTSRGRRLLSTASRARRPFSFSDLGFSDSSLRPSRPTYKLDWCYDQGESIYNVYNGEVKHLIQWLFCGQNACVIAYGARGSGKSQLIQGSEENLGLAIIALDEILAFANENKGFVSVSCYEISQDHIYDLLEPKEQEVLILEDASKRIQLKGLSKGIREFVDPSHEEYTKPKEGSVFCHTNVQTKNEDATARLILDEKLSADATDCAKDDDQKYLVDETPKDATSSPPVSEMLREVACSLKFLKTQTNCVETPKNSVLYLQHIDKEQIDPQTPGVPFTTRLDNENISYIGTPQDIFKTQSTGLKKSLVQDCLAFLNSASKVMIFSNIHKQRNSIQQASKIFGLSCRLLFIFVSLT